MPIRMLAALSAAFVLSACGGTDPHKPDNEASAGQAIAPVAPVPAGTPGAGTDDRTAR